MKKFTVLIIAFSILLLNFSAVSAASVVKTTNVLLTGTPEIVNVGETVELTATTQKQGSEYSDSWSNAIKSITVLDNVTGTYVSKAVFTAVKEGTYTISYNIGMCAGSSGSCFAGKVERTIIVKSTVTLIGADIRNLIITPVLNSAGSIVAYTAYGKIYTLWSDQSVKLYSSIFFSFGANETEKTVNVDITDNGVAYNFPVTVKR